MQAITCVGATIKPPEPFGSATVDTSATVMRDTRACAPDSLRPDPCPAPVVVNVPWSRVQSPLANSMAFRDVLTLQGGLSFTAFQTAYPQLLSYLSFFLRCQLAPRKMPVFAPAGATHQVSFTSWTAWFLLSGPSCNTLIIRPPGLPIPVRFDVPTFHMSFTRDTRAPTNRSSGTCPSSIMSNSLAVFSGRAPWQSS